MFDRTCRELTLKVSCWHWAGVRRKTVRALKRQLLWAALFWVGPERLAEMQASGICQTLSFQLQVLGSLRVDCSPNSCGFPACF